MSSLTTTSERVAALVDDAFDDLSDPSVPLSVAVAKAKRIARLRSDFDNLLWIELELRASVSAFKDSDIAREISAHYPTEEAQRRGEAAVDAYVAERTAELPNGVDAEKTEEKILAYSVRELEDRLQMVSELKTDLEPAVRQQVIASSTKTVGAIRATLARIEHRVHDFLSATEKQLLYGQINADIFERNRNYVDTQLGNISPRALEQISSAYRRAQEGDDEARSQALLSCRRALKSVADLLCPASDESATDATGTEHALTEDKWRNRLVEFVKEKLDGNVAGDVLQGQLDDVDRRLKGLSEASSRGVHADVTGFELNQTVIQTYLTIGDLLRLHDDDSGLVAIAQGFAAASST